MYYRRYHKFYPNTTVGSESYNPKITLYYDSSDNLLRVEEEWRGEMWSQTISGSNFAQQWPNYSNKVVYYAWERTTIS